MGKFAIQCPKCSHYVTAHNDIIGFFKRKVTCGDCGEKFDVNSERITSVECPHCASRVVYDQGKKTPKCPVCHNEILPGEGHKLVRVKCPTCGVRMEVTEGTKSIRCHICDTTIDVAREVGREAFVRSSPTIAIKHDLDNNTFVWKSPYEDFGTGSQLIVHESQEAIFFRDGQALDLFGPGRHTLETQNLPMMGKLYKLPTDDPASTFHAEVYFINMVTLTGLKWGTPTKIRLFEPMTGMNVSIGAGGEFHIRVVDSRKLLLKLVGTTGGLGMTPDKAIAVGQNGAAKPGSGADIPTAERFFRGLIITQTKSVLARAIKEESLSIFEIDQELDRLSEALRNRINEGLEEYGLMMPQFMITRIMTPEDDQFDDAGKINPEWESWMKAKSLFAKRYTDVEEQRVAQATAEAEREKLRVKAETEAQMRIIEAQGAAEALRIQRAAEAEAYRMQAEAEAAEMRMKGYTYQQETSRQIGVEAMKNGLTGGGNAGSAIGDIAGLGITLGAMGGVIGMAKEAMQPMVNGANEIGQTVGGALSSAWDCPMCGTRQITSKCCPECGAKRPEAPTDDAWVCPECGTQGIQSKFCPECGTKRPEQPALWDCPECGARGIQSKFCPECGHRREE